MHDGYSKFKAYPSTGYNIYEGVSYIGWSWGFASGWIREKTNTIPDVTVVCPLTINWGQLTYPKLTKSSQAYATFIFPTAFNLNQYVYSLAWTSAPSNSQHLRANQADKEYNTQIKIGFYCTAATGGTGTCDIIALGF